MPPTGCTTVKGYWARLWPTSAQSRKYRTYEKWGQVTDNIGWINEIKRFPLPDMMAAGYAVHALTDAYNNMTMWKNFITQYSQEAAKGYNNDYYRDLAINDVRLYQEEETQRILHLLPLAQSRDFYGLVSAEEIDAIRASLYSENNPKYNTYAGLPPADTSRNTMVFFAQVEKFIEDAAIFVKENLHFPFM
jgi:hypothetical protein